MQNTSPTNLTLFCWNIANPSKKRAETQSAWIRKQNADVFVLTECKNSEGCLFIEKYLCAYGYNVIFPKPEGNEYGVIIASKHKLTPTAFSKGVGYIQSRVVSASLQPPLFSGEIEIVGTYLPSRDSSKEKIGRKKQFINSLVMNIKEYKFPSYSIFCGDLNILEPYHIPHYSIFQDWEYNFYNFLKSFMEDAYRYLNPEHQEYSWVGRTGDGYRYDHCFTSLELLPLVRRCYYLHEPRIEKLSDHSALITHLALQLPRGDS